MKAEQEGRRQVGNSALLHEPREQLCKQGQGGHVYCGTARNGHGTQGSCSLCQCALGYAQSAWHTACAPSTSMGECKSRLGAHFVLCLLSSLLMPLRLLQSLNHFFFHLNRAQQRNSGCSGDLHIPTQGQSQLSADQTLCFLPLKEEFHWEWECYHITGGPRNPDP